MDANTIQKPTDSASGLETVRAKAKQQRKVRLHRAESDSRDANASHQKMKTLKAKANEAMEEELRDGKEDMPLFDRIWDWFQRAVGNR